MEKNLMDYSKKRTTKIAVLLEQKIYEFYRLDSPAQ